MKGKRAMVTAAILVAGIRMWMQVRGKTKTPFGEWAVGWGVTFFFLAIVSEAYPQAASALAGTIVVGDFLVNGASLFEDLSSLTTGAEKAGPILAPEPFAAASIATTPSASGHGAATGGLVNTPGGGTAPYHPPTGIPTTLNGASRG